MRADTCQLCLDDTAMLAALQIFIRRDVSGRNAAAGSDCHEEPHHFVSRECS
jgi:hypothetical protein